MMILFGTHLRAGAAVLSCHALCSMFLHDAGPCRLGMDSAYRIWALEIP